MYGINIVFRRQIYHSGGSNANFHVESLPMNQGTFAGIRGQVYSTRHWSMLRVAESKLIPMLLSEAANDNVIHKESGDNQFHAGTDYKTDENAD